MADQDENELLELILAGWEGIEEEDGTPIVFDKKTLKEFADDPYWIKLSLTPTPVLITRLSRETERCRHLLGEWRQASRRQVAR